MGEGSLTELAKLSHPGGDRNDWDWRSQISRSIVIDDRLYTISSKGIMTSDLNDLDEIDWLGF